MCDSINQFTVLVNFNLSILLQLMDKNDNIHKHPVLSDFSFTQLSLKIVLV